MDSGDDLAALALLADPVRRRLYDYLSARPEPVGRDEAANGADISRKLAAFHLDRMAEAGLLDVSYRRLSGRTGRGAGRPAKLYTVAARRLEVTLPQTRYALAGRMLARAMAELRPDEDGVAAIERVARDVGAQVASARAGMPDGACTGPDATAELVDALRGLGFTPVPDGRTVVLRNCPFDALACDNPSIVCAMNRALVESMVHELAPNELAADPTDPVVDADGNRSACCVTVRPRAEAAGQ